MAITFFTLFPRLPPELRCKVVSYLSPIELVEAALINREWYEFTNDLVVWESHAKKKYQNLKEEWQDYADPKYRFQTDFTSIEDPLLHPLIKRCYHPLEDMIKGKETNDQKWALIEAIEKDPDLAPVVLSFPIFFLPIVGPPDAALSLYSIINCLPKDHKACELAALAVIRNQTILRKLLEHPPSFFSLCAFMMAGPKATLLSLSNADVCKVLISDYRPYDIPRKIISHYSLEEILGKAIINLGENNPEMLLAAIKKSLISQVKEENSKRFRLKTHFSLCSSGERPSV
jgi:hypothetical protein